jgi:cobalamin biosynthesis protein CbiD
MNTQLAFAFGMLAMVAITMLVVLVVGMVKVIRHEAGFRNIHNEINDCHRHISDTERNFYSELNEFKRRVESSPVIDDVHRRIDDEIRNIVEEIHNIRKHVDSRFDKFENKIMATTTTDVATTKKQLLKD